MTMPADRLAGCAQAALTAATAWERHDQETLRAIDDAYDWAEFYAGLLSVIDTLRRSWAKSAGVPVEQIDAKLREAYQGMGATS
jgi:hypothetical protein